ncbi:MAG: permease [Candidatus Wallbacteria bacterium]
MLWKDEFKNLLWLLIGFLACYYIPVGNPRFDNALKEALELTKWYAQEHVLLCLVPAFFIAGAISVFVSKDSVMKYLGPKANKFVAYGVASVSGTILAVCSCTILPLFTGIYKMGAGLGPAIAFLYSGPAISVLAIIITARILGLEIGVARAVGAVSFSIIIGAIMHFIYRNEELEKVNAQMYIGETEEKRNLWQTALYFFSMVGILVFANWAKASEADPTWFFIYANKWVITSAFAVMFAVILVLWYGVNIFKMLLSAASVFIAWILFPHQPMAPFIVGVITLSIITSFDKGETGEWFKASWDFAKQIMPLLLGGVFISGFLLGRPGNEGIIPNVWISQSVGGNSIFANFISSVIGAFMYFATLTEVPILQGLIGSGMGKGPALALLLAGPALSLPSMLVIKSVIGTQKTAVYVTLVVIMATITGLFYGMFF